MLDVLQQSLLFLPLVLGIYFSFCILKVVDLTADGSFVLGAAVFAKGITCGYSATTCTLLALGSGFLCGVFVSLLQKFSRVSILIAGILSTFMLYSVNVAIMGRPTLNLLDTPLFFHDLLFTHPTLFYAWLVGGALCLVLAMTVFLHSRCGLLCRAFGANARLLQQLGKSPQRYLTLGLGLSNSLAALAGLLAAQMNGYADVYMGVGMALTAIGTLIIGQKIVTSLLRTRHAFSAPRDMLGCLLGALLYFAVLHGLLSTDIQPIYLKLNLGIVLIFFLALSRLGRGTQHHERDDFTV